VNPAAEKLGMKLGITGKEAPGRLQLLFKGAFVE